MKQEIIKICLAVILFYAENLYSQENFWERVEGPFGGMIVTIDTTANNEIFTGTFNNGFFRSTDDGKTWVKFSGYTGTVISIMKDKKGNILFTGLGVNSTTDNGVTWKNIALNGNVVSMLCKNSKDDLFAVSTAYVYRSTDGGKNWLKIDPLPQKRSFQNIYPAYITIDSKDNIYYALGPFIILSKDNGETWKILLDFNSLDFHPVLTVTESGNIFLGTRENGIFRSTDNGQTWLSKNNGIINPKIITMALSKTGNIIAGTADSGIYISTDNGENWIQKNRGLGDKRINFIRVNNKSIIFAGSQSRGIFYSTDNGENWIQSNFGLSDVVIEKYICDKKGNIYFFNNNHLGGVNDPFRLSCNNLFKYMREGNKCISIDSSLESCNYRGITINKNDHIYIASDKGIICTMDYGKTWEKRNTGISDTDLYSVTSDAEGNLYTGTGYGEIFFSKDEGMNWEPVCEGMVVKIISALACNSKGYLFIGTFGEGIFRSTDKGKTWQKLNSGLGYLQVMDIDVDNNDHIYVHLMNNTVYYSKNDGLNWEFLFSGQTLPAIGKDNRLFTASVDDRVWETGVDSINWKMISDTELKDNYIHSIGISPDGYLFAGTRKGLFRSKNKITGITVNKSIPVDAVLNQNYPNPFNPSTVISYHLPGGKDMTKYITTLKIFDLLGREVQTLIDEKQSAGEYKINFNCQNLPGGVYFYRLNAKPTNKNGDAFDITKKLLLLK
jgi:photosystem II stability/assembly factor-like uncharacterized protein